MDILVLWESMAAPRPVTYKVVKLCQCSGHGHSFDTVSGQNVSLLDTGHSFDITALEIIQRIHNSKSLESFE